MAQEVKGFGAEFESCSAAVDQLGPTDIKAEPVEVKDHLRSLVNHNCPERLP